MLPYMLMAKMLQDNEAEANRQLQELINPQKGAAPVITPGNPAIMPGDRYPLRDPSIPDEAVPGLLEAAKQANLVKFNDRDEQGNMRQSFTNEDLQPYILAGIKSPEPKPRQQINSQVVSAGVMEAVMTGKLSEGAAQHLLKMAGQMSEIEQKNRPEKDTDTIRNLKDIYGDVTPENYEKFKRSGEADKKPIMVYDKEGSKVTAYDYSGNPQWSAKTTPKEDWQDIIDKNKKGKEKTVKPSDNTVITKSGRKAFKGSDGALYYAD